MSEVKPSLALTLVLALAVNVQLWTSLKEFLTSFSELWTSSGILGPLCQHLSNLDHILVIM